MASQCSESETMQRVPLIVVLGATGTGKSKLALQIAAKYAGEVISADSMQVYTGLNIITNKVTAEEKLVAQHHLLDCVSPLSRFTVVDFRNRALPIIDDLLSRPKMPVIVGGTIYYIEALLWQVLLAGKEDPGALLFDEDRESSDTASDSANPKRKWPDANAAMKVTINPSLKENGQAIGSSVTGPSRSVEETEGKAVQVEVEGATAPKLARRELGGNQAEIKCQANDSDCCKPSSGLVLLLPEDEAQSDASELLVQRLRTKDLIVSPDGEELREWTSPQLHDLLRHIDPNSATTLHPNNRRKIIRSLQVWQQHGQTHSQLLIQQRQQDGGSQLGGPLRYPHSVIFWVQCQQDVLDARLDARVDDMMDRGLLEELEEFHRLYNADRLRLQAEPDYSKGIFQSIGFKEFHKYLLMPSNERISDQGQKHFREGVENLKMVTRRYARKQLKWIRNRFLRQPDRQVPPVFGLDATDPSQWEDKVEKVAYSIVDALLQREKPPIPALPMEAGQGGDQITVECPLCQKSVVGSRQWQEHLKSRRHQKLTQAKKRNLLTPDA